MIVVTVINDIKHFSFNLLRLSCALNNLKLVVLLSTEERFYNMHFKDQLLEKYLQDIDDEELILFTDGNDAVFMSDEEEIIQKFQFLGGGIIFSAETRCWPDQRLSNDCLVNNNSPYRFLNSGGFIGRADAIREFLNDKDYDLKDYPNSNQYLWTKRYIRHSDKISIDFNCEIFCTFSTELGNAFPPTNDEATQVYYYEFIKSWFCENFIIIDNRIINKTTGTRPCHAHFNGHSKYLMDDDIINLVYSKIKGVKEAEFYSD